MNAELSLIDTDILSYILKDIEPVYAQSQIYLEQYGKFTISCLTYYECIRGYKAAGATRRLQVFQKFLELTEILEVDQQILDQAADIYAELRPRGIFPGEIDNLLGATALVHDLCLVTNNTAHYLPIHESFGLRLDNWMNDQ